MNTKERRIGIRELKARLSECVRDVKSGATVIVTERGRPVARLVPEAGSLEERLDALRQTGAILWSGRRLGATTSDVHARGAGAVADIVIENRG